MNPELLRYKKTSTLDFVFCIFTVHKNGLNSIFRPLVNLRVRILVQYKKFKIFISNFQAKKIDKIGMHSSDTGLIHFDDVRVPASNIIGDEGMGFVYQMLQFQVKLKWFIWIS